MYLLMRLQVIKENKKSYFSHSTLFICKSSKIEILLAKHKYEKQTKRAKAVSNGYRYASGQSMSADEHVMRTDAHSPLRINRCNQKYLYSYNGAVRGPYRDRRAERLLLSHVTTRKCSDLPNKCIRRNN